MYLFVYLFGKLVWSKWNNVSLLHNNVWLSIIPYFFSRFLIVILVSLCLIWYYQLNELLLNIKSLINP